MGLKPLTLERLRTFYVEIAKRLVKKVDKVDGKGLSEVDVTNEMKTQWDTAEKNTILTIQTKTADDQPIDLTPDETRNIIIPMISKFSELSNDLEGDDALLNQKFYQDTIAPAIAAVEDGSMQIILCEDGKLPVEPREKTIYLVPKTSSGEDGDGSVEETNNIYEEYLVVTTVSGEGEDAVTTKKLEKIGDTKIDLSGYLRTDDVVDITEQEILEMMAEVDAAENDAPDVTE